MFKNAVKQFFVIKVLRRYLLNLMYSTILSSNKFLGGSRFHVHQGPVV